VCPLLIVGKLLYCLSSEGNMKFPVFASFLFLISIYSGAYYPVYAESSDSSSDNTPDDIWSQEYVNQIHPWGGDAKLQFKEYHSYETMKSRMSELAIEHSDIISFHEGMDGGTNARGEETSVDTYDGWYYGSSSPWVKITGAHSGVQGGECNQFVGDCGNYADISDIQIVGTHHAREWMSYEVPMMFLETIAYYYGSVGIDNDGDGLVDEDPFGDADGDGILDDDGDCLSLNNSFQDSNGDGLLCGPGDLGVDEDFSEEWLTNLVNTREIYLIPMLNVDGNIYDREVYCPAPAWESCPNGGWKKNLRGNEVSLLPDLVQDVDEDCDGVDLNRNYQFEWSSSNSSDCDDGVNNDEYSGPTDSTDNDGDGQFNEDPIDGKDDDADGMIDEDWLGGNSEPETKFIQDLTEMNDDDDDGASDFIATLAIHAFSELILYPWGHCTDCQSSDHDKLMFHGDQMAEMAQYSNMQSSDLYPTSGDYCDWQYGVHGSYCYTIEIGTAFHQQPEDINHIAVRTLGVPFYMVEISDNPSERASLRTSINITEIGPLMSSVETFVAPNNGTEFPVLYLKESFHIDAVLSQSNGQSVGDKCLNIYLDPQENNRPISSINTSESDGMIEWFSGNSIQNPSLKGVETSGGELEGFRLLRVAFEPDLNVSGGCDENSSGVLNGSHMDIVVLVRSRVDIQVLQTWSFDDENGLSEGDLVIGEVTLLRDRLDLAIENEEVSFLRQYYSYSEEWVTELIINSTTNEQGRAGFEWEFGGKTCKGQPCPGVWRIIAHYPGSMFFAPPQNISHELHYKQSETSDSNVGKGSEDEYWDTAMDIVEISALIISLISLLLYVVLRKNEKESDLDELADKIVSKQNSIEKTKHKIENTDMKTSGITQNHEQIPKMETHDSDSKQDLEDSGKNVSIVQNITYNIQDSSIVGDMNPGVNSDLE
jgi:hypothetical protein